MKAFLLLFCVFLLSCGKSFDASHATFLQEKEEKSSINSDSGFSEEEEVQEGANKQESFRFAIISDLNGSYGSKKYNAQTKKAVSYLINEKSQIDFVLSTGDMVAGQKSNLDYEGMWESFHNVVTRPLLQSGVAFLPSPGNHDAAESRKIERAQYLKTWKNESPLSVLEPLEFVKNVEQNFPFQYAVKWNGALFVALDNTTVKPWRETTLAWMEKVFSQVPEAKFKFVFGHVPLLPFAFKKETEYVAKNLSFLNRVEELFEKHKVNVFFSGHSHVYYPGRRDLFTEYISVPLLGSGARHLISRHAGKKKRSERGFLVVECHKDGDWKLKHYSAESLRLISDKIFPEALDMPSVNSSLCKHCSVFPKALFLDKNKRILYKRSDLR